MDATKQCSRCGKVKPITDFWKDARYSHGVSCWCKSCYAEYKSERILDYRDYMREYQRELRSTPEGREAHNSDARKSSKKNGKKILAKRKLRYATDLVFRMEMVLRSRLHAALNGHSKSESTVSLLGCSIDQLLGHLEINFEAGMSWENYGKVWHVDHKKPCAAFDLTKPEDQRACFNWKNLQPLFAKENLAKGARCAEYKPLKERNL